MLLDIDCYSDSRTRLVDPTEDLKEFRELGYRAFRWAIQDLIKYFV